MRFFVLTRKNNGKVLIVSVFSVCPVGPAVASYLKLMTSVAQGHDVQTERARSVRHDIRPNTLHSVPTNLSN